MLSNPLNYAAAVFAMAILLFCVIKASKSDFISNRTVKKVLFYAAFGGCGVLLKILTFCFFRLFNVSIPVATAIAWFVYMLFSYLMNKFYVFKTTDTGKKAFAREIILFYSVRVIGYFADTAFITLFEVYFRLGDFAAKVVSEAILSIASFFINLCIVFKSKK